MEQIRGTVIGQSLSVVYDLMAEGTNDYLEATFKFSPEWDGLDKWVKFCQDEKVWDINLVDNKVGRDKHLNLDEGYWTVCLYAMSPSGMRITTDVAEVRVRKSCTKAGEPPLEVPPSAAEQIALKADEALKNSEEMLRRADSGEFDGKDFTITKVYPSVEAMLADHSSADVSVGDFVLIETGSVDNPDNSKMYVKTDSTFEFVTDLSGAQGIRGPQGYTFTPAQKRVEGGVEVSWSNDGGLGNPPGVTLKDGKDGTDGAPGEDGKTPVKGVDYFTSAEIAEMQKSVEASIGAEQIKKDIQGLEDDKANYKVKVIAKDHVRQEDAREVLEFSDQYDGRLIEFLTNGDNPSKCVATGRLMTDASGNSYLVTYNRDGTMTQWSRDSFEKHLVESRNLINELIVDIDTLTVDIPGNPPVLYSVRNAKNKPESGPDGTVFVMPHAINKQLQFYTDMDSGKQWYRTVGGTDGRHSFGTWVTMGGSGGGASVQSDWNVNDPENPAYIKNRICYEEIEKQEIYINPALEFVGADGEFGAEPSIARFGKIGDNMQTVFDGKEYSNIVVSPFSRAVSIGNLSLLGLPDSDTGEPFCVVFQDAGDYGTYTQFMSSTGGTHSVEIYLMAGIQTQIDEKYIPGPLPERCFPEKLFPGKFSNILSSRPKEYFEKIYTQKSEGKQFTCDTEGTGSADTLLSAFYSPSVGGQMCWIDSFGGIYRFLTEGGGTTEKVDLFAQAQKMDAMEASYIKGVNEA